MSNLPKITQLVSDRPKSAFASKKSGSKACTFNRVPEKWMRLTLLNKSPIPSTTTGATVLMNTPLHQSSYMLIIIHFHLLHSTGGPSHCYNTVSPSKQQILLYFMRKGGWSGGIVPSRLFQQCLGKSLCWRELRDTE